VRRLAALAVLAAASLATWLAWIAYGVLCEEGCAGRPWPLIAQLVAACTGFLFAAVAAQAIATGADARARVATAATAVAGVAWVALLIAAV
jgi:hypothetical protein